MLINLKTLKNLTICLQIREAVTSIEYALIASLVAVVLVTGAKLIGLNLSNTFSYLAGRL